LQTSDVVRVWFYRLIGVAAFLLVWLVISSALQPFNPRASTILPSPVEVFTVDLSGLSIFADGRTMNDWSKAAGVIVQQSAISLLRLICGGLSGITVGILTGMLIGYSRWVRALTEPVLLFIRTIPILALIPLFLVWFGGSETGNIIYIGFAVFAMVVINTIEAIRNVPPVYFQYARTLGASRFQAYRTVILPAMVPELIGGIRVVLGLSWAIVLAAEYLASQSGLGRILIMAEKWLYTGRMIVVIFLIVAYSLLLNWLFLKAAKYVTRWMPE
jgi:ABC-type nitrate/sulfonate/bicarbonate transport system permease component